MIPLTMTIFSILDLQLISRRNNYLCSIGIIIARTLGYDALTGAMVILGVPVVSVEVC